MCFRTACEKQLGRATQSLVTTVPVTHIKHSHTQQICILQICFDCMTERRRIHGAQTEFDHLTCFFGKVTLLREERHSLSRY